MPRLYPQLAILDSLDHRPSSMRGDSLSIFAENQLQQLMTRNYNRKYPELDALEHFPLIDGINPWAVAWAYDSFAQAGEARFSAPGAKDIARADVTKERNAFPVRLAETSYGYTLEELMASQMAGVGLSEARAASARRAIEQLRHTTVLVGESGLKIPGGLNNASVPIMSAVTGAWLGGATTAEQMLADLNAGVTQVWVGTNKVHQVNTVALPNAHLRRIQTLMLGTNANETVASFFLRTTPGVSLTSLTELGTAGPASAPRAMFYQKSPENQGAIVPLMFQQLPPEMKRGGLETIINCFERMGGAVWFYPASGVMMDGI
jgi:hypothetical protein